MSFFSWLTRAAPAADPFAAWWREAEEAATRPDDARLGALARARGSETAHPDEAESQIEMIEALSALASLLAQPALPRIETQHRVVGTDTCHFIAAASIEGRPDGGVKLLLTANRLVLAGGSSKAYPWHRIRRVARDGRHVSLELGGGADVIVLQCNSYTDALLAQAIAERLHAKHKCFPGLGSAAGG